MTKSPLQVRSMAEYLELLHAGVASKGIPATVMYGRWSVEKKKEKRKILQLARDHDLLVLLGSTVWEFLIDTHIVSSWTDGVVDFQVTIGDKELQVLRLLPIHGIHQVDTLDMQLNWVASECSLPKS